MKMRRFGAVAAAAACAVALTTGARGTVSARQASAPLTLGTSTSLNGFLAASLVFIAADADKDGVVTRAELATTAGGWFEKADTAKAGAVTARAARARPERGDARLGSRRGLQHGWAAAVSRRRRIRPR